MHWWMQGYFDDGQYWILYLHVMWVIVSICLHELAHGWAALQQGDTTPRDTGHMTWNPMVHMGPWAIVAFVLAGITWGCMPVNPNRFKWGRWGDAWVAAAGPLTNLVLAVVCFAITGVLCGRAGLDPFDLLEGDAKLIQTFLVGGLINIALFAFNLIPVPPLDGAAIVGGLSRATHRFYHSEGMQRFGILLLIVVFSTGIGSMLVAYAKAFGWIGAALIADLFRSAV